MQYTLFMICAPVVAIVMVACALNVRRQKRQWLTRPLLIAIWFSFGFLVTNALELAWPTVSGTMLFAKLSYPFSALIPVMFFIFTLAYTGRDRWLAGASKGVLFIIPFLTTALAATEPLHHWIWTTVSFVPHGPFLAMNVTYGWFFWVNTVYEVGVLLISMFLIAVHNFRVGRVHRAQALLAIIGGSAPLALFFIYALKIIPGFTKNFSPIAYAVSAVCFLASIRQHGFLDVVPVARRALVEQMADAMIAVDPHARVIDLNDKARTLFDLPEEAIGTSLPAGSELRAALESTLLPNMPQEISLLVRGRLTYFDARVTPVNDTHNRILGSIVLLRDVTDAHYLLEEKNRLINELSEASAEINALRGIIPICMYCKKIRDDEGYWHQVETYVAARSLAHFSHGLCPDCMKKLEENNYAIKPKSPGDPMPGAASSD